MSRVYPTFNMNDKWKEDGLLMIWWKKEHLPELRRDIKKRKKRLRKKKKST